MFYKQETDLGIIIPRIPFKKQSSRLHSLSLYSFFNLFIYYLFLVALGLCCCAQAFSSCSESGLLFVAVRGLLVAVASLVVEHGL